MLALPIRQITPALQRLRKFVHNEDGGALPLVGLGLSAMIGFAGLGVDVSMFYFEKRATQGMADAAAISGAYTHIATEGDYNAINQAAIDEAVRNGYLANGTNQIQVALAPEPTTPVLSRPSVEVVVRRQVDLLFLSAFRSTPQMIAARAVGGYRNLGTMCVIALEETEDAAVSFQGSASANIDCGVASNSSSNKSIYVSGQASLFANPAQAFGDINVAGSGQLISNLPPLPYSPRVADPYEDTVFPPAPGTCDINGDVLVNSGNTLNISPTGSSYMICGDLEVRGTLNLAPGTYYIYDGDVSFGAQSVVTGTDVTLVITGSTPSEIGTININAGADIDLVAPSSGDYAGMVIYLDEDAERRTNKLLGGATMNLRGVVYLPGQDVEYSGGSNAAGCTQVIARTVTFIGDSYIDNDPALCQSVGVNVTDESDQKQIVLVE